jgi:hypothetical protein
MFTRLVTVALKKMGPFGLLHHSLYFLTFLASLHHAHPTVFLWFQVFSLNFECSVLAAGFSHKLFSKPPLTVLMEPVI